MLWDSCAHRFEGLKDDQARIRDPVSGELREVPVAELRALPTLPAVELDQRLERSRTIENSEWTEARRRETIIRQAISGGGSAASRIKSAAEALSLSASTVRRLVARYKISAQTTSLLAHQRGPNKRLRRLGAERERLIDTAIDQFYLLTRSTICSRVVIVISVAH